jgi:hypothetical protein
MAYRMGWINENQLGELAGKYPTGPYNKYLLNILEDIEN